MKKFILLTVSLTLVGCGWFQDSSKTPSQEETHVETTHDMTTNDDITEESQQPSNAQFDNVFDESLEEDASATLPPTQLPNEIPIGELREAINGYFVEDVPAEEQDNNLEPVRKPILKRLQEDINEDKKLKQLNPHVDQVSITLNNETQYVVRLVVPMTYTEAERKVADNDIQLLNTALSTIGNRLVMVAYMDESGEYLIPYHLNTSTYSLFSMREFTE